MLPESRHITVNDRNPELIASYIQRASKMLTSQIPQTRADWASLGGSLTTFASIFSQGLTAGLLWNDFLTEKVSKNVHPAVQISTGILFFSAALAGKFGFIHFCNDASFRELATYNWSEMAESKFWTSKKTLSLLSSLIGSFAFAGLSNMNMDKTYALARQYPGNFCAFLASFSHSPALKHTFFAANIVSNMLFFPYANTSFAQAQESIQHIYQIYTDPHYAAAYVEHLNQLAGYNQSMKEVVEEIQALIKQYQTNNSKSGSELLLPSNNNLDDIAGNLATITNAISEKKLWEITSDNRMQHAHLDCLSKVIGLAFAGICMSGYINFFAIAESVIQPLCKFFNLSATASTGVGITYAALVMISMAAIALIATIGFKDVFRGWLDPRLKTHEPQLLTRYDNARIYGRTGVVCLLGAFPNTYQAWKIANEDPALITLAFISSAISETQGVHAMVSSRFIAAKLKELTTDQRAVVTRLLNKVSELNNQAKTTYRQSFLDSYHQRKSSNPSHQAEQGFHIIETTNPMRQFGSDA